MTEPVRVFRNVRPSVRRADGAIVYRAHLVARGGGTIMYTSQSRESAMEANDLATKYLAKNERLVDTTDTTSSYFVPWKRCLATNVMIEDDLKRGATYVNRKSQRAATLVYIFPGVGVEYRYITSGSSRGRGLIRDRTNTTHGSMKKFLEQWTGPVTS